MSVEYLMAAFDEGSQLDMLFTKKLNEVERKIEVLVKKGDEVTAEPFTPGEKEAG